MKKYKRNLNNIKSIPYNDTFSLKEFVENYTNIMNESLYELHTIDSQLIQIVFLERHLPHIIGLHHFIDRNAKNPLLRKIHNLSGQDGFDNMIEECITFDDLINSRKGSVWKNKKNKKRILSMHLLPDIIRNSTLYLVDGSLKGKINAKYILKSTLTNTCYSLCIDEDIKLDRLGEHYCCISNLIDDSLVNKLIKEGYFKQINLKRIIKKEFYGGNIFEVIEKEHLISTDNPGITTREVSIACIGDLLLHNCTFSAVYSPELGKYIISYFWIDSNITKVLMKYK